MHFSHGPTNEHPVQHCHAAEPQRIAKGIVPSPPYENPQIPSLVLVFGDVQFNG
jgi:hypothetical protein